MTMPSAAGDALPVYSTLPLWIVLIPLAGSFFVYRAGLSDPRWRDRGALLVSGITFILALLLFWRCGGGTIVELKLRTGFLDPLLYFRVDFLGAIFTLLASAIWLLATVFSLTYMSHESDRNRYYIFYLLSLGGCLGVFLAGDLLSLFIFFEIMTFTSYVLVVHARTKESDEAGRSYLFLGVLGGLMILGAILLLYYNSGSLGLLPRLEELDPLGGLRYLLAFLLFVGFGIKAGAVPLHIWLPKAHPVAPSPASALLSAIMIKTGAYGIIRVFYMLYTPRFPETTSWATAEFFGLVVIWIGTATMFIAAFTALFQNNAKRILAYSSISQMGYILMGIGCAALLGYQGAMGFSGTVYHIINHAFFKASLFMLVGTVYVRTHRLDLRDLGGLWRSFPVTTFAFLVAAAGITGVPGLNGYTSKTLIHHAIEDVYKYSGDPSLFWAERIFTVTGALTVCYIIKLFTGIFFGRRPEGLGPLQEETKSEKLVFGFSSAAIIFFGIFPSFVMNKLILPAGATFSIDPYRINYLAGLDFWNSHDLLAVGRVLGLGLLLFILLNRLFYRVQLPAWLGVEQLLYRPATRILGTLFTAAGSMLERRIDRVYVGMPSAFAPLYRGLKQFEENHLAMLGGRLRASASVALVTVHKHWVQAISALLGSLGMLFKRGFRTLFQFDRKPSGENVPQTISMANLDFNLLIIVMTLIVVLGVIFFMN